MKHAVETGSGAMVQMPSFLKIGSGTQKLLGRGDSQTHRQYGDRISLLQECGLKVADEVRDTLAAEQRGVD
jgi:hypothetical protein